ncbi:unnamed protein product [Hydatigera taeniaeformis]|uniref:DH domain-containing protein n=1 Tax=Hydatigena taeniaeformis TaxID=6205 RepID=A0A0R3X1G3_HYDTA|nr:unnamed protein product [Hydatigera taeniaeformis]
MTDISEKLSEIERNIQEGETMLTVLRRLPESEETNDQIKRFQDLVRQLEEYKERYKALQTSPLNDFEPQLEALRDKHERIKMLLEQSAIGELKPLSPSVNLKPSRGDHESSSSLHLSVDSSLSRKAISVDASVGGEQLADSYSVEPSQWRLHYETQMRQLSSMLSQIARFQEMVGRLSNLVIGLDMTEAVNLLSDVGQRFTDVHLRLLSLQSTYEVRLSDSASNLLLAYVKLFRYDPYKLEFVLYNSNDPSNDFKANQLKDLRGFLISLGRSLEVTKECFFTVASIVRKTLHEPSVLGNWDYAFEIYVRSVVVQNDFQADGASADQTAVGLNNPVPPTLSPEPSESRTFSEVSQAAEVMLNEEEPDYSKKQKCMELTIAQLCKQREALLNQLAEARAKANGSTSSPKNECGNTSEPISSASFSNFDRASKKDASALQVAWLSDNDTAVGDPLPILKRLQARKEHLEELRGELRSFSFPNGDEASSGMVTSTASEVSTQLSLSSNAPLSSGAAVKVTPPRLHKSPQATVATSSTGVVTSNLSSAEASMQTSFPPSDPPTPRRSTQNIPSVVNNDSDEPEATYLDNTERLYKSMREARIWREEHRQAPIDSAAGDTEGDKTGTNGRLKNGALSESTSCMDATAMATWGGDSDREGNDIEDDMVVGGECVDVSGIVSSRSSRANRHFIATGMCSANDGGGSSTRACLGVRADQQESGVGLSLPHLGHSPSPHPGGSRTVTTLGLQQQRQSARPFQSNHREMEESSFEEYALTKPLAAKIANLEFKVEQLTQTCRLLVSENARLSSALSMLFASQRLPSIADAATSDWPVSSHSRTAFVSSQQSFLPISTGVLFSPAPSFRPSESVSGLSSAQPLVPAPLTPTLHAKSSPSLEKALDQMLTAQVIEQHSRMNQLQNDLHVALQQQQQQQFAADGEVVSTSQHLTSASGMRVYPISTQPTSIQCTRRDSYQSRATGFSPMMASQVDADPQSRQPSSALPSTKYDWSILHPKS